jgi:hypothetical protein
MPVILVVERVVSLRVVCLLFELFNSVSVIYVIHIMCTWTYVIRFSFAQDSRKKVVVKITSPTNICFCPPDGPSHICKIILLINNIL